MSVDLDGNSSANLYARLYTVMRRIRIVEEHIQSVYATDVIQSPVHLSIGQEWMAAALCDHLQRSDLLSHTYRSHASALAKGMSLYALLAELYGKTTGCAGGKAGSMHLVDSACGLLGASAIVGSTIPVAAGYALALQLDNKRNPGSPSRIVACMFGDGATEEGVFSETLQFASLRQLPMLFFCENNQLAIHSRLEQRWPHHDFLQARARAAGIECMRVDDGNILTLWEACKEASTRVRSQQRPCLIECMSYRALEHVGVSSDDDAPYRNQEEKGRWQAQDAFSQCATALDSGERARIDVMIAAELDDAVSFAQASAFPEASVLLHHVYAGV